MVHDDHGALAGPHRDITKKVDFIETQHHNLETQRSLL
jgi:hypothetical protein